MEHSTDTEQPSEDIAPETRMIYDTKHWNKHACTPANMSLFMSSKSKK